MAVSARCLATHLNLDYSVVKKVVRGLIAWGILKRTADGLQFQLDARRWESPGSRPSVVGDAQGVPRRTLRLRLVAKGTTESRRDEP
jgi:hypothetical protein